MAGYLSRSLRAKCALTGLTAGPFSLLMHGLATLAPGAVEVPGFPAKGMGVLGSLIMRATWEDSVDEHHMQLLKRTPVP